VTASAWRRPAHPGRAAYTALGHTRRVRAVPAPHANLAEARHFACKWLARIGHELDDDFGRARVPFRVHSAAHRLVRWAETRSRQ
jgi:hypothetical protein